MVFKKNQVSPRTFEGVYSKYKLHIEPKIGNMKIDEITPIVIQKILNQMIDDGFSLDVVRKTSTKEKIKILKCKSLTSILTSINTFLDSFR